MSTTKTAYVDGAQTVLVDYKWMDMPDAAYKDVLSGHYTIAADKKGLRIANISGSDAKKSVPVGLRSAASAWNLQGDYSIPRVNRKAYAEEMERARRVTAAGGTFH